MKNFLKNNWVILIVCAFLSLGATIPIIPNQKISGTLYTDNLQEYRNLNGIKTTSAMYVANAFYCDTLKEYTATNGIRTANTFYTDDIQEYTLNHGVRIASKFYTDDILENTLTHGVRTASAFYVDDINGYSANFIDLAGKIRANGTTTSIEASTNGADLTVKGGDYAGGDGGDLVLRGGIGTVTSGDVKITSNIQGGLIADPDEDQAFTFGRGKLGYDGATADVFCLGHYDSFPDIAIDSAGKVGIGTVAPITDLTIYDAGAGSSALIQMFNDNTGVTATDGFKIGVDTDEAAIFANNENTSMKFYTNTLLAMTIDSSQNIQCSANADKVFTFGRGKLGYDGATADVFSLGHIDSFPDITIDSSGNVGIQESSPDTVLHVTKSSQETTINNATQVMKLENSSTDTSGNLTGMSLRQTNGTNSANSFIGLSSTGSSSTRASMIFAPPNTSGDATTRMYIESDGGLFLAALGTLSGKADVQYDTSTKELGYVSSSSLYKDNIQNAENKDSEFIWNLKPRIYDRKDGSSVQEIGLIAEEVEQVNPKIVCKKKVKDPNDDKKEIEVTETYSRTELIIPMLHQMQILKGIITAQAQTINNMDNRIKALEDKANDFENRIKALEIK